MASNTNKFDFFGSDMYEDDIQIVDNMSTLSIGSLTSDTQSDSSVSRIDLFKKPERLIYTDDNGKLEIKGIVLSALSRIDKTVNVVGVCGLYRTGKSYLMNWIAGEKKGFNLGDTIQSETKGIWIWCKKHPTQWGQVLVLVDTEGSDDPEKGDQDHDNKLFCLTLLLCSTLIINLKDAFNYSNLDKLAMIVSLSNGIKILNGEDEEKHNAKSIPVASPRLIICIRDFHLKNFKDGRSQTTDDYLDDMLKPVQGTKPTHEKFNEIKESIKQYFPKRKCFTLAQPAMGEDLQNIETLDEKSLNKNFLKDIKGFQKYLYERKPKYVCNTSKKTLDGADLAALITSYVKSLRQNSPIQCEDAYAQASAQRNERVLHKVIKEFKTDMEKSRNLKSKTKLQDVFLMQFEQTLTKYRADSLPYHQEEYEGRATDEMKKHVDMLNAELSQACQKVGKEKLSKMYDEMLEKNSPRYLTSDGYRHYEEDMNKFKEVFFEEMKDYDKDELYICLEAFKKSKNDDKMTLYRAATGRYDSSQYNAIHDKINKKMNGKLERVLQNEIQKRNKFLEEELKRLRAEYKELSKSVESRSWCSVM